MTIPPSRPQLKILESLSGTSEKLTVEEDDDSIAVHNTNYTFLFYF